MLNESINYTDIILTTILAVLGMERREAEGGSVKLNGVIDYTDIVLTAILVVLLVILAVLGAIAIRFKFDINKWLEYRKKERTNKMRNICPHARIIKEGSLIAIKSAFSRPRRAANWECQMCGLVKYDIGIYEDQVKYWAENLDDLACQTKKFQRELDRMGY